MLLMLAAGDDVMGGPEAGFHKFVYFFPLGLGLLVRVCFRYVKYGPTQQG
jgi:hypothetical protein